LDFPGFVHIVSVNVTQGLNEGTYAATPPSTFAMKTDSYLVIGGCGLLGGHIIDLLLKRGEEDVVAFDLIQSELDPKVKIFIGDITSVESLRQAISSVRFMYGFQHTFLIVIRR
jgi:hypothetical protein